MNGGQSPAEYIAAVFDAGLFSSLETIAGNLARMSSGGFPLAADAVHVSTAREVIRTALAAWPVDVLAIFPRDAEERELVDDLISGRELREETYRVLMAMRWRKLHAVETPQAATSVRLIDTISNFLNRIDPPKG